MTEPARTSEVPEADRTEESVSLPAVPAGVEVPEADALEQQRTARPSDMASSPGPIGEREANEADVLEQEADVPVDEEDVPS